MGPKGATHIFGPQKGVKESDKEPIDKLLGKLIGLMKEASDLGRDDVENEVGAGGRFWLGVHRDLNSFFHNLCNFYTCFG